VPNAGRPTRLAVLQIPSPRFKGCRYRGQRASAASVLGCSADRRGIRCGVGRGVNVSRFSCGTVKGSIGTGHGCTGGPIVPPYQHAGRTVPFSVSGVRRAPSVVIDDFCRLRLILYQDQAEMGQLIGATAATLGHRGDPPDRGGLAQTQERRCLHPYGCNRKDRKSSPTVTLTLQHTIVIGLESSHDHTITQSMINNLVRFGSCPPGG
jgi:hypothetical protein